MTRLLRKKDLSSPMSELIKTIVLVMVMWFGGEIFLGEGKLLSPEMIIGYIVIFSQIIPPVKSFTSAYYFIQKGSASAARIHEILDTENDIQDAPNAKSISTFVEEIKFKGVTFSYENKEVLKDIKPDKENEEIVLFLFGQEWEKMIELLFLSL